MKEIFSALYASKLVSYAQGFAVLQRASDSFGWNLDLASIARMWRGDVLFVVFFLNDIAAAFEAADKPKHLLLAPYFREGNQVFAPRMEESGGGGDEGGIACSGFLFGFELFLFADF